ncbi:MAG: hypothetical protein IJN04_05855 [Clostridia bacterium]|nr:hypothetical protein [Clostridia bacterium]
MSDIVFAYRGVQLWQTHRGFEVVENGRLLAVVQVSAVAERLFLYRALALATAEVEQMQQQAAFTEEGKRVFFPPPAEPEVLPKPKESTAAFKKPTVEEIDAYCAERKNGLSGQAIYDHYESNGWMVGRVKMKDWKAAVRTWEKKAAEFAPPLAPKKGPALTNPTHSSLDIEFEEAMMRHRPRFKKGEDGDG